MLVARQICLLAHFATASASYTCTANTDCEMLGECVAGQCKCFAGFSGPSCAQISLTPVESDEFRAAAWPPAGGFALENKTRRAYGWGFSVARDVSSQSVLHAVANVGCYSPGEGMVTGTFLMHLTSTQGPTGPWKAVGIVAPPTTFNAHLRLTPSGEYVLFFRSGENGKLPPSNWADQACAGVDDEEWKAMVAAGPYIHAEDITDPIGNFVAHSKSMSPGSQWDTRPFQIIGQDATVSSCRRRMQQRL